MKIVIDKQITQRVINDLICSGKGTGYSKLQSLLLHHLNDKYGDDNNILKELQLSFVQSQIRNQFLAICDMLLIFGVDFNTRNFGLIEPTWVKSAVKDEFILIGSLSDTLHDSIGSGENNYSAVCRTYRYNFKQVNFNIELTYEIPDIYISVDKPTGYSIIDSNIPFSYTMLDVNKEFEEKLIAEKLVIDQDNFLQTRFKIDYNGSTHSMQDMSSVKIFDWIDRKLEWVSDGDLSLKFVYSDLFLVQYQYENDPNDAMRRLVLFERGPDNNWASYYFPAEIEPNWGRYLYMHKLKKYDLFNEAKEGNLTQGDLNNLSKIIESIPAAIEQPNEDYVTTRQFKSLKRQLFIYDKKKQLFGVPAYMPLPNSIRKALCICSGEPPEFLNYKFINNPRYVLWREIKLQHQLDFVNQPYFKSADYYVFKCVPQALVNMVCELLVDKKEQCEIPNNPDLELSNQDADIENSIPTAAVIHQPRNYYTVTL
jgi:hypothetical protein